jgi:hypothetical protein
LRILDGRGNDAKNDWKTEEAPVWAVLEAMIEAVSGLKLFKEGVSSPGLDACFDLEWLLKT